MQVRNLVRVGFLTWLIVAISQAMMIRGEGELATPQNIAWLACYLGFGAAFWLTTRPWCEGRLGVVLIAAQAILATICIALQARGFQAVLLVIVAGQLGHLPTRASFAWITVQTIVLGVIHYNAGAPSPFFLTLAYFTFQLFGIFVTRIANEEREGKQALAQAHAELQVATGLLDISSRTEERLRIARDLHDLLGHHLTALSLNLEVASHLATGTAREHIEKSQSLTRLLLGDVRDVVSRLREEEPVNLRAALESIRDAVDSPSIHVEAAEVTVTDPTLARTLLRAVQEIVTNSVRHSGARNLWLSLSANDHRFLLDAHDDGSGTDEIRFGNGLRGMRERVEQTGGTIEVASSRGRGFELHIVLPMEPSTA